VDPASAPQSGNGLLLSGFIQNADIVVQLVVAILLIASVASWAIIIEKVVRIRGLRRIVGDIERLSGRADLPARGQPGLVGALLAASDEEIAEAGLGADLRGRIEAAMRAVVVAELRRQEAAGLSFLATVASTAPFVGLFGTVWGIMHSFSAIAAAKDTSLAAVAPGIAEALFATAIGLGTAIPAVVGYNQIRAAYARCGQRLAAATAAFARTAARARAAPALMP
jgi:biopolymer transport protein TolQ